VELQHGEDLLLMRLMQWASNGQEKEDQVSTFLLIGVVHNPFGFLNYQNSSSLENHIFCYFSLIHRLRK
jgi:hypothetical protein